MREFGSVLPRRTTWNKPGLDWKKNSAGLVRGNTFDREEHGNMDFAST